MAFPIAPNVGDTYTLGNVQYKYNSLGAWDVVGSIAGSEVFELKNQTINTSTVYTDKTTGLPYKLYIDNGQIVLEEL